MNAKIDYPMSVTNTLKTEIYTMALNPQEYVINPGKDFTRKRKLDFANVLLFLIIMGNSNTDYELVKYFDFKTERIPGKSALIQQRAKLKTDSLLHLMKSFNKNYPLGIYKGKYNLIAVDGCEFNIYRNPNDPDTYYEPSEKTTLGYNMIHTIPLYDIISKRYLDIEFQPSRKKNEFQAYCILVDRYEKTEQTAVFIADRGFASYNCFAHTINSGHKFVIRAKDVNVKRYLKIDSLPDYLDTETNLILTRSNSKKKRLHPEKSEDYRYVCKAVTFDFIDDSHPEYELNLRIVRFDLGNGNFENIITNLSPDECSAEELKELYWMRWKIETSFRDLKHTIGTENFHSKSVNFVSQEILARMILFNFSTTIISMAVVEKGNRKHQYQVNFSMAMKLCIGYLQAGGNGCDIISLMTKFILPIRENRIYARQHRFHPPVSLNYKFI